MKRFWVVAALVLALVLAQSASGASSGRVVLTIAPGDVLVDQPVSVRATGLHPDERVLLRGEARDVRGRLWRSTVGYRASGRGILDTQKGMRLFWAMAPADGKQVTSSAFVPPTAATVTVAVIRARAVIARARFVRRSVAPGVEVHDYAIGDTGFVGTYSALPSSEPRPALLTLGGSAGGHGHAAALSASHGYPTLSVGYFGEAGLPAHLQRIPLEYFANALRWLAHRPEVDPARIGVLGVSRGAELAILLAATYPDLIDGVWGCTTSEKILGGSPSGPAWTLNGSPVPFGDLPVTSIRRAPVVITGGGKDEIIESAFAATDLARAARANGQTNVVAHVYPAAGHGVGCRTPNVPIPSAFQLGPSTESEAGGTPAANALAAQVTWPLFMQFLRDLPAR